MQLTGQNKARQSQSVREVLIVRAQRFTWISQLNEGQDKDRRSTVPVQDAHNFLRQQRLNHFPQHSSHHELSTTTTTIMGYSSFYLHSKQRQRISGSVLRDYYYKSHHKKTILAVHSSQGSQHPKRKRPESLDQCKPFLIINGRKRSHY